MEYQVILLNYGLTDIEGNVFTKLEYCFATPDNFVQSKKIIGVTPQQIFIKGDHAKFLNIKDILKVFLFKGELVSDFKKPLNKKFKLTELTNLTDKKDAISIS